MRLTLPLPPNRANARHSWRVALNAKKAYWNDCNALLHARKLPRPPSLVPRRIRLSVRMYVWSFMDDDNAIARLKPVIDWLKSHGYVIDDRRENILWEGFPEQCIDRKDQRVVLEIEAA